MSDYFPADLWIEILIRLPAKALIRFTAVSKSWKSLITSPNFISAHLSNTKIRTLLRRYDKHDKHEHYSLLEFTAKSGSFGVNSLPEFEFPFKSQIGYFRIVGSCDGLVCLTDDFFLYPSQPVILWNPSVRNHVVLPQAITNPKGPHIVVLGFGVADRVYKVVRLVYCRKPDDYGFGVPPKAEIFSVGTRAWREVSGFDIKLRILEFMWCQVLLKGVVHWLGYEPIDDRSSRSSILAFNIGTEVFSEVMLPNVLAKEAVMSLCLFSNGDSLSVVKYSSASDIEACDVWTMKEYGVKESWTKLYSIDLNKGFERVVGFRNGEALLAYQGLDLVTCNLETRQTNDLGIRGTPRSFYIDNYVESLLLLKLNGELTVEDLNGQAVERMNLD